MYLPMTLRSSMEISCYREILVSSLCSDGRSNAIRAEEFLAYTIAEPCIDVKDTACVDVCPVDCIHPTKNETEAFQQVRQLYIDPVECIDCGACEPVCPVEAISENDALPEKWKHYAQINADYYKKSE